MLTFLIKKKKFYTKMLHVFNILKNAKTRQNKFVTQFKFENCFDCKRHQNW